jgi:hypothetical protein
MAADHDKLKIEDAVNETCPWTGRRVAADALTTYQGAVVGFAKPADRDKFEKALAHFEDAFIRKQAKVLAPDL